MVGWCRVALQFPDYLLNNNPEVSWLMEETLSVVHCQQQHSCLTVVVVAAVLFFVVALHEECLGFFRHTIADGFLPVSFCRNSSARASPIVCW